MKILLIGYGTMNQRVARLAAEEKVMRLLVQLSEKNINIHHIKLIIILQTHKMKPM